MLPANRILICPSFTIFFAHFSAEINSFLFISPLEGARGKTKLLSFFVFSPIFSDHSRKAFVIADIPCA